MAQISFNCPQCGQMVEADESLRGRTAECPYCKKGIVVPRVAANVPLSMPPKTSKVNCPHCGTEYEVGANEIGHNANCEVCGKDFIIRPPQNVPVSIKSKKRNENNQGLVAGDRVKDLKIPGESFRVANLTNTSLLELTILNSEDCWHKFKNKISFAILWHAFFKKMKLVSIKCPKCGTEGVACVPEESTNKCICRRCHSGFPVEIGWNLYLQTKAQRLDETGKIVRQMEETKKLILRTKDILDLPQQASIFEADWIIAHDPIIPKRLQLSLDGLRARLTNMNLAKVVNAQKSAEATNLQFGNTVGLRNPSSRLYGFARTMVQLSGAIDGLSAASEAQDLAEQSFSLEQQLEYYESMMTKYYDLCAEFQGKEKDEAWTHRLEEWTHQLHAKYGTFNENELAMFKGTPGSADILERKLKDLDSEMVKLEERRRRLGVDTQSAEFVEEVLTSVEGKDVIIVWPFFVVGTLLTIISGMNGWSCLGICLIILNVMWLLFVALRVFGRVHVYKGKDSGSVS